jgi:hypothetical protein
VTVYVFDLDGTLCTNTYGEYEKAEPFYDRIKVVNSLYDAGNTVKIHTARGMGRNNDDSDLAQAQFMDLVTEQLKKWGVKYHSLAMGKPSADYYIDDRGIDAGDFFKGKN